MAARISDYFDRVGELGALAEATDEAGRPLGLDKAIARAVDLALAAKQSRAHVIFIGNGGSAGIAGHMATDWLKNGGFAALSFNDPAQLTCIANDLGYEQVFAVPIERLGRAGDLLFAISSSGRSPNILNAAEAARRTGMTVVTLSGFDADNPLRRLGDVNLWLPEGHYGFVEIGHLTLLHAILDIAMGWRQVGDRTVMGAPALADGSTE